jgi:hypothetical protein
MVASTGLLIARAGANARDRKFLDGYPYRKFMNGRERISVRRFRVVSFVEAVAAIVPPLKRFRKSADVAWATLT